MINILISVDSNYLDKACTMLFSLRLHTEEEVTVYILNHQLSDSEIKQFDVFLEKKCRMKLVEIDVSNTALDDFPIMDLNFSIEMYYRILAQFLLPQSLDRILWLDADIVLIKDITEFYHQDFDNMKYVVCPDSKNECDYVQECKVKLQLLDEHVYFNSGVLLMNLELLRKETNMEYILEQCNLLKDKLTYPDQDILNYLYQGQVKYADWKQYNYQLADVKFLTKQELAEAVVLHYTGQNKPWNYWQITNVSKYYWRARFKQGDKWSTIKAYLLKLWEVTVLYFRELKDILF